MELGSIERDVEIDAAPEVVYEVISSREHLQQWWPDTAELAPVPGGAGLISFGDPSGPDATVVPLTVVEADPPRRFAFRWAHAEGDVPAAGNSMLVTFDLIPSGTGTLLRFTEVGFRERGWEAAVLAKTYAEHGAAWDHFLPRLAAYAARLGAT